VLFIVLHQFSILITVLLPSAAADSSPQTQSSWSGIVAKSVNAISGNSGAVNVKPGIGLLGRMLGFDKPSRASLKQ